MFAPVGQALIHTLAVGLGEDFTLEVSPPWPTSTRNCQPTGWGWRLYLTPFRVQLRTKVGVLVVLVWREAEHPASRPSERQPGLRLSKDVCKWARVQVRAAWLKVYGIICNVMQPAMRAELDKQRATSAASTKDADRSASIAALVALFVAAIAFCAAVVASELETLHKRLTSLYL
jgi:hypothetical protein